MIRRDLYLNRICDFIDKPFIKVITGIRRGVMSRFTFKPCHFQSIFNSKKKAPIRKFLIFTVNLNIF